MRCVPPASGFGMRWRRAADASGHRPTGNSAGSSSLAHRSNSWAHAPRNIGPGRGQPAGDGNRGRSFAKALSNRRRLRNPLRAHRHPSHPNRPYQFRTARWPKLRFQSLGRSDALRTPRTGLRAGLVARDAAAIPPCPAVSASAAPIRRRPRSASTCQALQSDGEWPIHQSPALLWLTNSQRNPGAQNERARPILLDAGDAKRSFPEQRDYFLYRNNSSDG
jgi:hypothetical protein